MKSFWASFSERGSICDVGQKISKNLRANEGSYVFCGS